jgi:membrane protease YdiL (CAAX protease family)
MALGAFVIWTLITVYLGTMITGGEASLLDSVTHGIGWAWLGAGAFILAVVCWQGWWDVGLDRGASLQGWSLTWLPMLYIVAALGYTAVVGLPPLSILGLILLNTFFVGFSEELMFRGALLQAFRRAMPIWGAVLLTSVAFGSIHTLNVFLTGDLKAAALQAAAAFLSGLVFIALRLRTGSLWPPILLHALWDFATFTLSAASAAQGSGDATGTDGAGWVQFVPILLVLPNAIYGLWLMRDIGRTHADPDS